jgi:hypothetical protein
MYFHRIGCHGRVELAQENDAYGILIKVSFRNNVALQTLSAHAQSGGEKSVSTMLYLLCLQEVTNSPFRMVDEINQGMDAKNERTVFNQIVRSCEPKPVARLRGESKEDDHDMDDEDEQANKEAPQSANDTHTHTCHHATWLLVGTALIMRYWCVFGR